MWLYKVQASHKPTTSLVALAIFKPDQQTVHTLLSMPPSLFLICMMWKQAREFSMDALQLRNCLICFYTSIPEYILMTLGRMGRFGVIAAFLKYFISFV